MLASHWVSGAAHGSMGGACLDLTTPSMLLLPGYAAMYLRLLLLLLLPSPATIASVLLLLLLLLLLLDRVKSTWKQRLGQTSTDRRTRRRVTVTLRQCRVWRQISRHLVRSSRKTNACVYCGGLCMPYG